MNHNPRYSVGSLASLGSFSSGETGVDSSFVSQASTTSSSSSGYEIESEVGREALKEICCSALSRILDFPDDQLEVLLGYDEDDEGSHGEDGGMNVAKNIAASFRMMKRALSHKHQPTSRTASVHKYSHVERGTVDSNQPTVTFGASLSDSKQTALLQLIAHVHSFITYEGLFRKPGNKHRIEALVAELETKCPSEVFASGSYNAHDFASVLKKFLSDLPEPLLMKRHLDAYLQASALSCESSKICCLQLLTLLLPPVHRVVLQHLLELLSEVARFPENLMDAQNLALVFAPTLFLASRYETLSPETFDKLTSLLKMMVIKCEDIFEAPAEVQVIAERYCIKKKKECTVSASSESLDSTDSVNSIAIDVYSTSCQREAVDSFHQNGQDNATAELASLYEVVQKMPDGPQKSHFLKRFELASKMPTTPVSCKPKKNLPWSTSKKCKSHKKNKENATPKIKLPPGVGPNFPSKPYINNGSLVKEFDLVDSVTPCKSADVFKTPSVKRFKFLPTMSPMVTDV